MQGNNISENLKLDHPVSKLPKISSTRSNALAKMGIFTMRDLLNNFPRRYMDMSVISTIGQARSGNFYTIVGTIHKIEQKEPKPGVKLIEITIVDDSGTMIVTYFGSEWLLNQYKDQMKVAVSGKVEFNFGFKRMTNPMISSISADDDIKEIAKIIPVHPATADISPAWMRRLVKSAIDYCQNVVSFVPSKLTEKYRLLSFYDAYNLIHFPKTMKDVELAKRTLKFMECLLVQSEIVKQNYQDMHGATAYKHNFLNPTYLEYVKHIPFELTKDQIDAFEVIKHAMSADMFCRHLLFGDVGTGKTILAFMACMCSVADGHQAMFAAPTEILAWQHYNNHKDIFEACEISVEVLTGSTPAQERAEIVDRFNSGQVDILIGTHALGSPDVAPNNVSLIVIDEEHKFGVEQRQKIISKGFSDANAGGLKAADVLFLTATPIPRSLALTIYGNITFSTLQNKPNAAAKTSTYVVHRDNQKAAYDAAFDAIDNGHQVFVVCPLIGINTENRNKMAGYEPDDDDPKKDFTYNVVAIEDYDNFSADNPQAVMAYANTLQNEIFTTNTVGVLHGRMDPKEKQQTMQDFIDRKIDVLVCTTMIEVGVDVSNATVIIVEDADRFGLSQLHQLRGRIGRGQADSSMYLVSNSKREIAVKRLNAMTQSDNGLDLACYDLKLRREGDILGNKQHGASCLKLVNVFKDKAIIDTANKDACKIITEDPYLKNGEHAALSYEIANVFKE